MFGVLDVAPQTAAAPKMALSKQVSAAVSTLLGTFLITCTEIRGWQQVLHKVLLSSVNMGVSQGLL